MRYFVGFWFIFLLMANAITAQDIPTLLKQLEKEKDPAKLADINNLLAQNFLGKDGEKTITYAKAAIKYATTSKNNTVKAEALSFQAKAEAGMYAPDKTVPNRRNKSARQYYDAKNLFEQSMSLSKKIGYTQLELDNITNLAYLNTKKIGRHDPDKREEVKYYKLYISRLNDIKKVTKPKATYTVTNSGGSNSNASNTSTKPTESKPQSSGTDKFAKQLMKENRALKDQVDGLEIEVKTLEKDMNVLNANLKKALDSGTSQSEIDRIKSELGEKQKDASRLRRERDKAKKKREEAESQADEFKDLATAADERATRVTQGGILGGIIAALVLGFLFFAYISQSRAKKKMLEKNEIIAKEQERSEELLLNILPKDIAEELKTAGSAKARKHENVTVLFSDFKNFTKVAETLSPEGLVKELDYCFKGFDYIIEQYPSIEKIKTIGDAYMCCSGLSGKDRSATSDMVKAAMDMQEFLFDYKADRQSRSLPFFEARIGIHNGPVVSGVVGNKKFAYDVWGDTVNVASRMESNGDVGKVNVSSDTYNEIRYQFSCVPRGKINVKNKGLVEMYFVDKVYT